jgi:hypothetical protein
MGIINYKGKLPIAVVLVWKGETIANALTDTLKNHVYAIANESVTEFTVTGAGGAPLVISRKATAKARYFDLKLNTYTTSPVPGDALDAHLAQAAPKGTIDLTFSYRTFFDKMLEQDTRTDSDLHNLANPNNSSAILDTFTHSSAGGVVRITYKSATEKLVAIPFKLIDKQITPGPTGKPPAVKLVLELDFLTGVNDARREAMRKLVAMDWSKLVRYGSTLTQDFVKVWQKNLYAYLANHSDKARGEKFRQGIVARHRIKVPDVLATELRNDIDLHIITANHWGEARESLTAERHQRLISDLFGTLHQSAWYASPVAYIREFRRLLKLRYKETAGLVLLYGAGHCGEHAQTSFSILGDIIDSPGGKISRAILTGNANIDHAFVVFDLDVTKVILTKATAANNTSVAKGDETNVWNLRETIAANAKKGYVLDPYLDPSVMKPTADELLTALNSKKRKAQAKDTDFLFFGGEHPKAYTEEDIRAKSEAERRSLVKHV